MFVHPLDISCFTIYYLFCFYCFSVGFGRSIHIVIWYLYYSGRAEQTLENELCGLPMLENCVLERGKEKKKLKINSGRSKYNVTGVYELKFTIFFVLVLSIRNNC